MPTDKAPGGVYEERLVHVDRDKVLVSVRDARNPGQPGRLLQQALHGLDIGSSVVLGQISPPVCQQPIDLSRKDNRLASVFTILSGCVGFPWNMSWTWQPWRQPAVCPFSPNPRRCRLRQIGPGHPRAGLEAEIEAWRRRGYKGASS